MIVYQYWAAIKGQIVVNGKPLEVTCYGGSDFSPQDAEAKARRKVHVVEEKIKGNTADLENYHLEIREELIERINDKNAITRNRYGALVLNSEDTVFLDIDEPRFSFFDRFRTYTLEQKKAKMLKQIAEACKEPMFKGLGFRIYETRKGYRVIVTNRNFRVSDPLIEELFIEFNCDPLYASLCRKQECFRARLTPKPSHMKFRGYKVHIPRSDEENSAFAEWDSAYVDKSKNFAVCRLIETIGPAPISPVISLHDQHCKVGHFRPLA